jgi:gamma-glutamylcyclotransferase (GGCT)/AIG2-like uncharacterized protein YtfP
MSDQVTAVATEEQRPIFVYGTLRQGESAEDVIARDVVRRVPARARARVLEINAPYPAAFFGPDEQGILPGELVYLKPSTYEAVLDRVDEYENVPFLFRRIPVTVEAEGVQVAAWAYTYTHASLSIPPRES